jgi:hypothetical protein
MRSHRQAGASTLARFRQERRTVMRRNWKDWVGIAIVAPALLVAVILTDGMPQVILAWTLGAVCMMAAVGWIIGGDVASLPWAWGAIGEQATGEVLEGLSSDWYAEHDVAYAYGNWDHILVGPAGVFMLDTKRFRGRPVTVKDGALYSGRTRCAGARFRGAAYGLKEALQAHVGPPLFVHAIVVVWGDFSQEHLEQERVTYIAGDQLVAWLEGLPPKLTPARKDTLVNGIRLLATTAEDRHVPQLELAQTAART